MNEITHEARREAYQAVLPLSQNRQEKAFEALRQHPGGLTAGEIAEATGMSLNTSRSALTELLNCQRVTVLCRRICSAPGTSKRTKVAVWVLPLGAA